MARHFRAPTIFYACRELLDARAAYLRLRSLKIEGRISRCDRSLC
ncbi:MAG: hypothetical protein AB1589_17530 [Cyanobacteriota bacterium]